MRLSEVIEHPSTILILGDIGKGKTATMAAVMQNFHDKKVFVGMLDRIGNYPEWVHDVRSDKIVIPPNSLLAIDDAHNYFYARDWQKGKSTDLDLMVRARRHEGKRSVVYTTQQSNVLDINLILMSSLVLFKEPSLFQIKMERKEVRDMALEAEAGLKKVDYDITKAYAYSKHYTGIVDVEMPEWFTQTLSEGKTFKERKPNRPMAKQAIGFVKAIGRMLP